MRWSWIWRDAWKTTVGSLVGSVLVPYVLAGIPGIGTLMRTRVSFSIVSTLTAAPISVTVPLWVLITVALLTLTMLVSTIRLILGRRQPKEVRICTYCHKVIGPGGRYVVVAREGPREIAHPVCYADANRTGFRQT